MSVTERGDDSPRARPLGAVAEGLRDVARVATGGDGASDLLGTALDALRTSLGFERAMYLTCQDDRMWVRMARPDDRGRPSTEPVEEQTISVDHTPALRHLFESGAAAETWGSPMEAARDALAALVELGSAARAGLVVPIFGAEAPAGLLVLSDGPDLGGDSVDQRTLEIATVYGALLGLGLAAVERAGRLEHLRAVLEERNTLLAEEVSAEGDATRALEASRSRCMRRLTEMSKQVARSDAPVLVTGETGTGKAVLARAIHQWSDRSGGPFVQLNCAALSDHLIESELFGHVEGAFSGAVGDRAGRFRIADGGTLLLDEIGEMPMDAQTKLLRVLEVGQLTPVGSDETTSVDVRVIAATNVELDVAIDRGRFREDLYFRLHVFPLHVPPLRERVEDIPVLVEQILARMQRHTGHGPWRVTDEEMDALRRYPWPGNVRELVNALERARVFSPLGGTLNIRVGDRERKRRSGRRRRDWPTLEEHQKRYIEEVLRRTNGKIYGPGGAAELLGIPPSTLQSRMHRLRVERPGS